jgi:serine/threonine protein kinase
MTLAERVETGVPLDTQLCLQGIRAGVAHLHSLGLAHNDINPYNVMMDAGDNPVLIDFDACTREGEALLKFGTPDWFDETVRIGSRQNDFYALRKMVEYLSRPWEQVAEERRERELMELNGEAEDVQY